MFAFFHIYDSILLLICCCNTSTSSPLRFTIDCNFICGCEKLCRNKKQPNKIFKKSESKCYNRTEQKKNSPQKKSFDKYRETHKNREWNATQQTFFFFQMSKRSFNSQRFYVSVSMCKVSSYRHPIKVHTLNLGIVQQKWRNEEIIAHQ